MKLATLIITLIFSQIVSAQSLGLRASEEQVLKARKEAVLKITILDKDLNVLNTGTGFFIGKKGHFLTNDHLVKEFNEDSNKIIQVKTYSGKFLKNIELLGCGSRKKIDACLFKTEPTSKHRYFSAKRIKIGKGHQVSLIGYCENKKMTAKRGKIVDYFGNIQDRFKSTNDGYNQKVQMVQTDAFQCPGDSGGPIFNGRGELVGMATNIFKSKSSLKQFNLGIHVVELIGFIQSVKGKGRTISSERVLGKSRALSKLNLLVN